MIPADMGALQIGIAMGTASMISIGPNNLMLFRSGISGNPAGVAAVTLGSYTLLVGLAVTLAGSAMTVHDDVGTILKCGGLFALAHFSVQAFRSALATRGDAKGTLDGEKVAIGVVLRTVWSNPLTYLELLLIPMSLAQTMKGELDRIAFAAALVAMSALCCLGYAYGGVLISRLLKARRLLACFDLVTGTIMAAMSASLAASLIGEHL